MNFFEFNKIAGAVLFTVLIVLGLKTVAGIIFHVDPPAKLGYPVQVAAKPEPKGGHAPKPEPKAVSIGTLLKTASVERGQSAMGKCKACHSSNKGGANKIGPNLYNVVGRKIGAAAGFSYSTAFKAKAAAGAAWGYKELNQFLAAPKKFLEGTKMMFGGIKKPGQRADLIAYLRSLSEAPKPLPEAPAADPKPAPKSGD